MTGKGAAPDSSHSTRLGPNPGLYLCLLSVSRNIAHMWETKEPSSPVVRSNASDLVWQPWITLIDEATSGYRVKRYLGFIKGIGTCKLAGHATRRLFYFKKTNKTTPPPPKKKNQPNNKCYQFSK